MNKTKALKNLTIQQLLQVQAHIGNKTIKWNPITKGFLFGSRYGIHLFDLQKTIPYLKRLLFFLTRATRNHQTLLFVGEHPFVSILVKRLAENTHQASITHKWVCGTLTNWRRICPYIRFLFNTTVDKIRKKFVLRTEKKIEQKIAQYLKMKTLFTGAERMSTLPNLVIIFDQSLNNYPAGEAYKLMLPIISIVTSGPESPVGISYPIIGNHFLFNTLYFYANLILQGIKSGIAEKRLIFLKKDLINLKSSAIRKGKKQKTLKRLKYKQMTKITEFLNIYQSYRVYALKKILRKAIYLSNLYKRPKQNL